MSQSITKARDGFTSTFGVLAATLGSAVGLGNIWKFPYLTGENGGAGFLLVYVIATLLVGLPVMISETVSYTHLDVYKRQAWAPWPGSPGFA